MSEPPKGVILNQHSVTIDVDGRSITGTYSVGRAQNHGVDPFGQQGHASWRFGPQRALDWVAKVTLHAMAQEGKA
jgi:hypothetical protein